MSKYLNKTLIKTGTQSKKNHFDLSFNHVTTQDPFKPKPVYIKEVMPGEKIKIDMRVFSRLAPLQQPFYGQFNILTRFFAVPFRTIMEGWNELITSTPYQYADGSNIIPTAVPTITNAVLCQLFVDYSDLCTWEDKVADKRYDLIDVVSSGSVTKKLVGGIFTLKGKIVYDILSSLGYVITFQKDTTLSTWSFPSDKLSALPLLAWCKIFYDWYKNPAYIESSQIGMYFKGKRTSLNSAEVKGLIDEAYRVCYEGDYFVNAWDEPAAPNGSLGSNINIADTTFSSGATGYRGYVTSNDTNTSANEKTPHITLGTAASSSTAVQGKTITQNLLEMLHRVTDFVRRNQYSGSRALDRYMAERGLQLDSAKLDRSVYFGKSTIPVIVSDVMQTSNDIVNGETVDYGVGNYTGKGIGASNKPDTFEFSSDEFCYVIGISYIQPKISYVDGRPSFVNRINNLDFFHGDFDSLGVQAIRNSEIQARWIHPRTQSSEIDFQDPPIFGFVNRMADYKVQHDVLSGDFIMNSRNVDLSGWYLARRFDDQHVQNFAVHSLEFTQGTPSDFTNLFVDNATWQDHFYSVFRFDVDSWMPAKPLYDAYDFESDGKAMLIDVNGTKVTN